MSGINPYGSFFATLASGNAAGAWAQTGQVTSVPQDLKSLAVNVVLKGQVSAQNPDGTTVISTPRGNVGVQFQNPPPVGTRVDIQITSGSPPKTAYTRPSLVDAVQQQQGQTQGQAKTTSTTTSAQVPTNTTLFDDVQSLQVTKQAAAIKTIAGTQIPQTSLQVGQAVRLTPLPVIQQSLQALAQNFIAAPPPTTQTITSNLNAVLPGRPLVSLPTQTAPSGGLIILSGSPASNAAPLIQSTGTTVLPQTPNAQPASGGQITTTLTISTTPTATIAQTPYSGAYTINIPPGSSFTSVSNPTALTQPALIPNSGDGRVDHIHMQATSLKPTAPHMTATAQGQLSPPIPSHGLSQTPATAGQITATVTGFTTAQGNPIVQLAPLLPQAEPQFMVMHYPAKPLPVGSQITLTPLNTASVAGSHITLSAQSAPNWPTTLPQFWTEAMAMPGLSPQLLPLMPSATQARQFPAAALLFLAAAKNGDLSGWLGQRPMKAIQDAGSESLKKLLQTLSSDLSVMATKAATASDPAMVQGSSDWRGYLLPLLFGASVDQTTLWIKDNPHDAEHAETHKKNGTRFVVDLNLSRMGDMQLDGYIQPEKKIFDLALHSQRPFGKETQNHFITLWTKTLEGMGLSGSMTFKESK